MQGRRVAQGQERGQVLGAKQLSWGELLLNRSSPTEIRSAHRLAHSLRHPILH